MRRVVLGLILVVALASAGGAGGTCTRPCQDFCALCEVHFDSLSTFDRHTWSGGKHFIQFSHLWDGETHSFLVRCRE